MSMLQNRRRPIGRWACGSSRAGAGRRGTAGLLPALEGLESRQLLATTPLPVGAVGKIVPSSGAIAEFNTADPNTMGTEIALGTDSKLWANQLNIGALFLSPDLKTISTGSIAVIDPATGLTTAQYTVPSPTPIPVGSTPYSVSTSIPLGITQGTNNDLWFTSISFASNSFSPNSPLQLGNNATLTAAIGRIDQSGHITQYTVPTPSGQFTMPLQMVLGPDGNLWFTAVTTPYNAQGIVVSGEVGRINATTGDITLFPTPTVDTFPIGITSGLDGNLYFTGILNANSGGFPSVGAIDRINPTTGAITEFPTGFNSFGGSGGGGPVHRGGGQSGGFSTGFDDFPALGIKTAPDGKLVYTSLLNGNLAANSSFTGGIGVFDPSTGDYSDIFRMPRPNTLPVEITLGPDGNFWFTEANVNIGSTGTIGFSGSTGSIGNINTTTGKVTEYSLPTPADLPFGIVNGPDGNLWFNNFTVPGLQVAIGLIELRMLTVPATLAARGIDITPTVSSSFTGQVATFIDLDPTVKVGNLSAMITWGDGTTSAGTITQQGGNNGAFVVTGTHTFTTVGTQVAGVAIKDTKNNTSASVNSNVTVQNTSVTATGSTFNVGIGTAFTGTVATISDPNPNATAGDFTASIAWGDGTTSDGSVARASGGPSGGPVQFNVAGTHTYNQSGTFLVTVTIQIKGGATITAMSAAVASTQNLTVTNTLDDNNPGSLRQAINAANGLSGATISFAVNTPGPYVLKLQSPLPAITSPMTINDTLSVTNPSPFVIDGSGLNFPPPSTSLADFPSDAPRRTLLDVNAPNTAILGLTFEGSPGYGIVLDQNSAGSMVMNNFIGTAPGGRSAPLGNQLGGLLVLSSGNMIANNVISGNGDTGNETAKDSQVGFGVALFGGAATKNTLIGNHIGTNIDGTQALPNFDGVDVNGADGNTITNNVISGNRGNSSNPAVGLYLFRGADQNTIQGNKIGVGDDPGVSIPNQFGVMIADSSNNLLGGTTSGLGNMIEGSDRSGVVIFTTATANAATGNQVLSNTIRDNHQVGVYILNASGNQIGTSSAGNTFFHNGFPLGGATSPLYGGVEIEGASATGNFVQGNEIQDSASDGVFIFGAPQNTISDNVITNSGAAGIEISGATGNQVSGNTISGSGSSDILTQSAAGNMAAGNALSPGGATQAMGQHPIKAGAAGKRRATGLAGGSHHGKRSRSRAPVNNVSKALSWYGLHPTGPIAQLNRSKRHA
jgi:parallel beta-helix repeat protein